MVQLAEFVASHWIDLAIPLGVTGGLIVVVLLVVPRIINRIDRMTPVEIKLTYWRLLVGPLCWIIGIVGLYSMILQFPLSEEHTSRVNVALAVAITLAVVYAALRVFNVATRTYYQELREVRDPRATYVGGLHWSTSS